MVQEDELRVCTRDVFHHQVMTEKNVKSRTIHPEQRKQEMNSRVVVVGAGGVLLCTATTTTTSTTVAAATALLILNDYDSIMENKNISHTSMWFSSGFPSFLHLPKKKTCQYADRLH